MYIASGPTCFWIVFYGFFSSSMLSVFVHPMFSLDTHWDKCLFIVTRLLCYSPTDLSGNNAVVQRNQQLPDLAVACSCVFPNCFVLLSIADDAIKWQ
jgi:hypothetical protein